jgi:hypothetical protein
LACDLQTDANLNPAYHFDADPDPAYHFDADPDPTFQIDRIRIHNTPADVANLLICLRCLDSIPVTAKRATNAAHLSFLTCEHNINK